MVCGYVLAALGLIGLMKVARGYRRGWRCAGGYGGHHRFRHWHGHHYDSWHGRASDEGRGGWRRWALYSLFERLDATPGQEKVISAALDELRAKLRQAREQWHRSKSKVAEALRGEHLTEEQANDLTSPYASLFDEMRAAAGEAMRKIHEALDERQRRILADLVDSGWSWYRA